MTQTLMILGARAAQVPAYRIAREMGLRIVGADPDPSAPGLGLADLAAVVDLGMSDELLGIARQQRVDAAMTLAADFPMPALAMLWSALDLPGPRPSVVRRATHKWLMRQAFVDAGVPCPRFEHVVSAGDAVSALRRMGCDVIFKPAMSQGGRGIGRVDANASAATIEAAFRRAKAQTRADGVMVEEFVDGPEYSVETLVFRGRTHVIAVTDKQTSGAPYYVETGHQQPSGASLHDRAALEQAAVGAMEALGIDQAAGHVELRMSTRGPVLMECAARAGGGFIASHLVPLSTGIDYVRACIQVALGVAPQLQPRGPKRAAAIRFVVARPGQVRALRGLDEARADDGVIEAELYVHPGDNVGDFVDSTARCGHVIAVGASAEDAAHNAEAAVARLEVETIAG